MNGDTIQKILNKTGPLSSIQLIERFFDLLQEEGICTLSKKESDRICMYVTNDCKDIFHEELSIFMNYSRENKNKGNNSISSSVHCNSDYLTTTPQKSACIEYGLSLNLYKQLISHFPLSSKTEIRKVMSLLDKSQTVIDNKLETYLREHTYPFLLDYLRLQIREYHNSSKPAPVNCNNNKPITTKKRKDPNQRPFSVHGLVDEDPIKKTMFSFRANGHDDSLSSQGYEYGLSDW